MKHNRILQRDYVVSFSPVCPSAPALHNSPGLALIGRRTDQTYFLKGSRSFKSHKLRLLHMEGTEGFFFVEMWNF